MVDSIGISNNLVLRRLAMPICSLGQQTPFSEVGLLRWMTTAALPKWGFPSHQTGFVGRGRREPKQWFEVEALQPRSWARQSIAAERASLVEGKHSTLPVNEHQTRGGETENLRLQRADGNKFDIPHRVIIPMEQHHEPAKKTPHPVINRRMGKRKMPILLICPILNRVRKVPLFSTHVEDSLFCLHDLNFCPKFSQTPAERKATGTEKSQ